ncbi:MAG: type II secretion system protein [Planctomycetes bacterium]|nr:type II secretion system protein [Planctomycetota bacterium]
MAISRPTRSGRGFTLVEILVVISIIALLAAISIPALSAVRRSSDTKATKAFLERLRLQIESYSNDFGDYPPSRASRIGYRGNEVNAGSEILLRCLTTSKKAGPYFEFEDTQLGNTDQDSLAKGANPTRSVIRTAELLEIVDTWGNPILYLHNKDYDRGGQVLLPNGNVTVPAYSHEKTKQFAGLTSFQLWSAGVDGEVGTDDDVRVFGE